MGVSTDGQISYGILFDEDTEFPWDGDAFEHDIEAWWMHVNGYENPHYCPFTEDGEYKDDAPVTVDRWGSKRLVHDDPRVREYYDYRLQWMSDHPVPVQLVNYCCGDCEMYIVAVKSMSCRRGYPLEVKPEELAVTDEERDTLIDFCNDYGIEFDDSPRWWLSSYWG